MSSSAPIQVELRVATDAPSQHAQNTGTRSPMETVEELEEQFTRFLQSHLRKVQALKHEAKFGDLEAGGRHKQGMVVSWSEEPHVRKLHSYLDHHTKTLSELLSGEDLGKARSESPRAASPTGIEPQNKTSFEALSQQFNMGVVISTFTAGLVIAFIALADSMLPDESHRILQASMLLCFFSMALHFGNILIAGRGAALTAQSALIEGGYDVTYYRHFLIISEQLQVVGTLVFLVALFIDSFFLFDGLTYPILLIVGCALATVIVFWSVYWRVSITVRNIIYVFNKLRWLLGLIRRDPARARQGTETTLVEKTSEKGPMFT
ncbi:hypothetical protein BDN72DRAFT_858335 [Pluteus cervinus]|uniref:Uncharacterized protein n=1 Tax=Pluteus cervinus TaxID=181527 RepID=A0ACD3ASB8_9AGAR|nr:hypothetical protein BDN72DRAFT_858335 [Pluteus cervinus]